MAKPVILWVEDNEADVQLLKTAFRESGLDAHFVVPDNAVVAYRYMLGHESFKLTPRPPNLIILDLNLPVIKGTSVLTEIKAVKGWERIPVVVLTSTSNPMELKACSELGAVECMTKPPTYPGYLDVVKRLRRYLPTSGGHSIDSDPPTPPISDPPSSSFFTVGGEGLSELKL